MFKGYIALTIALKTTIKSGSKDFHTKINQHKKINYSKKMPININFNYYVQTDADNNFGVPQGSTLGPILLFSILYILGISNYEFLNLLLNKLYLHITIQYTLFITDYYFLKSLNQSHIINLTVISGVLTLYKKQIIFNHINI